MTIDVLVEEWAFPIPYTLRNYYYKLERTRGKEAAQQFYEANKSEMDEDMAKPTWTCIDTWYQLKIKATGEILFEGDFADMYIYKLEHNPPEGLTSEDLTIYAKNSPWIRKTPEVEEKLRSLDNPGLSQKVQAVLRKLEIEEGTK